MNEVIKKLRIRKGITQKNIAEYLGIKQSTVSRIENGQTNLNFNTVLKIFLYLKASTQEINKFLDKISSTNCYNFFSMVAQDQDLRNYINEDPLLCIEKFKESLRCEFN